MSTGQIPLGYELDQFCQMAELIPWPVLLLNENGQPRYWNNSFRVLIPEAEQADLNLWLSPSANINFQRFVQECFQQQDLELSGLSHKCSILSGNRERLVKFEGRLIQRDEQRLLALFLNDQTVLQRRRQSKLEQYQQFRDILDNTGAVVYIKDLAGHYQYVNRLFESLFHVEASALYGKTDFDIFPETIATQFRQADELVLQSGQTQRLQEVATQDDGLHTYISVKFPLYNQAEEIVGVAGISTDITEQLWAEQEINAAQAVQSLLYPRQAPLCLGFDIAGLVCPAEVTSGDYYDYIRVSPTRLVIAIGDVSGHGLGPALEMVETRAYLRAILRTEVRLDVAMSCLNEFLCRDLLDSAFVTLFLVELDLARKTFRYVAAGHQGDFLKADGTCLVLKSTGLVLGIEPQIGYQCSPEIPFETGDILLLSTDGVSEAKNPAGELFGTARMVEQVYAQAASPAKAIAEQLIQTARRFSPGPTQADDMTTVILKCVGN